MGCVECVAYILVGGIVSVLPACLLCVMQKRTSSNEIWDWYYVTYPAFLFS